ncbi:hypothetical protein AGABI1DRAFT_135159 [Agaricus bisporus var. burnettii JB137-S8]|uniref:Uncharacterized protein n=1 Tax=Agaricus bisporus var. burnettii (strain JB137-S8 / ATCC MYA-4627 / FGSC 10392) TaxID=597362 RepID=K5WDG1_AGABU|nr:uncharacterized protein AGABI1DRAFT_135159 [Agaricus bisporus var. burnettii JB137-S8]EKM73281.1 hypothetical protein AGABI1DRAFT_135159 [Agaricus bisporus var. burnettii JB137-S8]
MGREGEGGEGGEGRNDGGDEEGSTDFRVKVPQIIGRRYFRVISARILMI